MTRKVLVALVVVVAAAAVVLWLTSGAGGTPLRSQRRRPRASIPRRITDSRPEPVTPPGILTRTVQLQQPCGRAASSDLGRSARTRSVPGPWTRRAGGDPSERSRPPAEPPLPRVEPVPAPARVQPGRLVPVGDEALARAAAEHKPIFLSIGYAACHWCHVMERESFEDPAIAALLAEHFVAVKVDREERPDVDAVYMNAVQAMTGSGGWPLSVFLTPERKPFFGGTYFPPERRWGTASFREVLETVAEAWEQRRHEIDDAARTLADHLSGKCDRPRLHRRDRGLPPRSHLPRRPARRALGWLRGRSEVPDALPPVLPDRGGAPRRDRSDGARRYARRDGRGWLVRLARGRLSPLLRRREVARAPLREDALRQRAPGAGVRGGRACVRPAGLARRGARDRRLPPPRDARPRGRVLLVHRRRQRGAGGRVLHLERAAGPRGASPGRGRSRHRAVRPPRERELRGRGQRASARSFHFRRCGAG